MTVTSHKGIDKRFHNKLKRFHNKDKHSSPQGDHTQCNVTDIGQVNNVANQTLKSSETYTIVATLPLKSHEKRYSLLSFKTYQSKQLPNKSSKQSTTQCDARNPSMTARARLNDRPSADGTEQTHCNTEANTCPNKTFKQPHNTK